MKICVVDVAKIMADSKPAVAARDHLKEVQNVLAKGLNDVVAMYTSNIASPEAQNAIAQARELLQRQMNVELQAADNVVRQLLVNAVEAWKNTNADVDMIVSRQQVMFAAPELDVTAAVTDLLNTMEPKFPALPTVTINQKEQPAK